MDKFSSREKRAVAAGAIVLCASLFFVSSAQAFSLDFGQLLLNALHSAGVSVPGGIIPPQIVGKNGILSGGSGGSGGGGGGGGGGSTFGGKIQNLIDCDSPAGAKWFIVSGPVSGQLVWTPGTPVGTPSNGKNTLGNASGMIPCKKGKQVYMGKKVTLIGVSQ